MPHCCNASALKAARPRPPAAPMSSSSATKRAARARPPPPCTWPSRCCKLGKKRGGDRPRQPPAKLGALYRKPRAFRDAHRARACRCRRLAWSKRAKRRTRDAADEDACASTRRWPKRAPKRDIIIIDTPGSDTPLSRLAHAAADTLVTPMNDSFVDFDLLAKCRSRKLRDQGSEPLHRIRLGVPQAAPDVAQARARLGGDAQSHFDRRSAQQAPRRTARR